MGNRRQQQNETVMINIKAQRRKQDLKARNSYVSKQTDPRKDRMSQQQQNHSKKYRTQLHCLWNFVKLFVVT